MQIGCSSNSTHQREALHNKLTPFAKFVRQLLAFIVALKISVDAILTACCGRAFHSATLSGKNDSWNCVDVGGVWNSNGVAY